MPTPVLYILKLSLSLAVVYLFYRFVLRKLTFYRSNRWYLLGYTMLCFVMPFINISPLLEKNSWRNVAAINWIPVITGNERAAEATVAGSGAAPAWNIIFILIATGTLCMLTRLVAQWFSFRRLRRKATLITHEGMNLYQVDDHIIPFSFGNSIFINRNLHSEAELEKIIRHEFVHVKQKHTIDIFWGELLCLLNWYNPFAWLLKRSIRQNLEFIADNKVVENGIDKKQYQYLLLKVIGNNQYSIATKFNFSSLKKRIAMMNKTKSAKRQLLRLLFLLPATAVLLLAFRNKWDAAHSKISPGVLKSGQRSSPANFRDTVPDLNTLNSKGYYINIVGNNGNCTVSVKDKTGKEVEQVLLSKWNADEKKYEAMYGKIPVPPPPIEPFPPSAAECPPNPSPGDEVTEVYIMEKQNDNRETVQTIGVIKKQNGAYEKYDMSDSKQAEIFKQLRENLNTNAVTNINTNVNSGGVIEVRSLTDVKTNINTISNLRSDVKTNTDIKEVPVTTITLSKPLELTEVRVSGIKSTNVTNLKLSPTPVPAVNVGISTEYADAIATGKEYVRITITRKTTREELDNFIAQMKAKNIELEFDDVNYSSTGALESISGTIRAGDTHGNFLGNDFETIVLSVIKKDGKTYFKVSTTDKPAVI